MNKVVKSASAVLAAASIVGATTASTVNAASVTVLDKSRAMYKLVETSTAGEYTVEPTVAGQAGIGNHIVFNSITNNPNIGGDERNFVGARENTGKNEGYNNKWNNNTITVEDGKEYLVRIYAHNNNPNGTSAIAKNVTLHYTIPTVTGTSLSVQGAINYVAEDGNEYRVYDDVVFQSDHTFYLDYVEGSALFENNGVGAGDGVKLSDSVITSEGAKIGYSSLNGEIPGCFKYDSFTTIRVKAVYTDTPYLVEKQVRLYKDGQAVGDNWAEDITANVGDIVEYRIHYKNTTSDDVENVMVKDILPNNMEYIKGSTYVYNKSNQNGLLRDDTITTTGVNIGGYSKNANGYVIFRAKVVDKSMVCGTNKLVNWAQVGVGKTTLQNSANVLVKKTDGCSTTPDTPTNPETPTTPSKTTTKYTELPSTGAESIAAGVVGAGSIVTAAGYFVASRKQLR